MRYPAETTRIIAQSVEEFFEKLCRAHGRYFFDEE